MTLGITIGITDGVKTNASRRVTKGLLAFRAATAQKTPAEIAVDLASAGYAYSQSTISRWLSGDRVPRAAARTHILDVYGVDFRLWDELAEAA